MMLATRHVLLIAIAHDKGKPVAKQGRKAIESPDGDCQAAEGIEEKSASAPPLFLSPFASGLSFV